MITPTKNGDQYTETSSYISILLAQVCFLHFCFMNQRQEVTVKL